GMPELLNQRAKNGERRGLFAALLLGEQLRQRLQAPAQGGAVSAEGIPMRMPVENRQQHGIQHLATKIERAKFHLAVDGDNLQRRTRGGEVPARISPRKFISGRKVGAAMRVQVPQETFQSLFEVDLGHHAGDGDTAGSGIPEFGHKSYQLSAV